MIELDTLRLDPAEFGSQGSAVLGIRDSGKTYTATLIAEKLFDAGIPFVAFDPIGVWRYLRVPGKGKGYPIVVAGGEEGDLPLTTATAPMIVEAAMQSGVSLVIDLFHMDLSKADWRRIVKDCVKLMLHRNKQYGLRHVFLEEAAEFAPQKIIDFDVYAEIEKLARMGGNSRLGYTLINQRAQEVNKAILELCENLFLHRQKGLNALANVKKWLDVAGAASAGVMKALPTLPQGECYAWLGGSDLPVHIRVPAKSSLHPDRRVTHGDAGAAIAKKVNVSKFVSALTKALPEIEEEAKAHDPKALRSEIAKLKGEIARLSKSNAPAYPDLRGSLAAAQTEIDGLKTQLATAGALARGLQKKIENAAKALGCTEFAAAGIVRDAELVEGAQKREVAAVEIGDGASRKRVEFADVDTQVRGRVKTGVCGPAANGSLTPGERAILVAAVQFDGADRDQLSVLTGYKKSSRDTYIGRLVGKGLLEVRGKTIHATDQAASALGSDYKPLPTGQALQDYWMRRLSPGEAAVLKAVLGRYPGAAERPWIDEITGYKKSSRDTYIQRLKARRLVEVSGDGIVAASSLF